MHTKKLEGIIISESNYSESSKILNLYTKELGIISIISKGCRRIKSNLRSVSSKLTYGNFIISYKENGLSTLISVDILDNFKNILTDIKNISYSTYILELASQVAKQNDNEDVFNLLISSLKKINEGLDASIITLILEVKYLKYLGIDISIDGCSNCGSSKNIITLNSEKGGYICRECYTNEKIVSEKTIKVMRLFYYVDIDKITKLDLAANTIKEINSFLEEYYDRYSGLYLKSKHFLGILNNKWVVLFKFILMKQRGIAKL